ncbi:MAG TPA: hypothetical protein VFZ24_08870 [Longimicrobiales bacterium]
MKARLPMAALAFVAVATAACEQGPLDPGAREITAAPQSIVDPDPGTGGNLHPESVYVCKEATGGDAATTFDFTATATRSDLPLFQPAFSLQSGQCALIAQAGGAVFDVTVTETAEPGFVLDSIVRYNATFVNGQQPYQIATLDKQLLTSGTSATGWASGGTPLRGSLIVYYNRAEEVPTGEGCTPGYWKQPQHFAYWTAPYTPSTWFADVFSDAFPGMTLLDVASLGGGGLKALGRHAVAALLNAANPSVDYGMTAGEVIAAFNAAYASGDYDTLKNQFVEWNERGCSVTN